MSAQPKPNEPSMEEILASIRRIIADDQAKTGGVTAPPVAVPPAEPVEAAPEEPEDDVLDLGREAEIIPLKTEAPASADDLEFQEAAQPEAEPEPVAYALEPEPAPVTFAPPPVALPEPALDMSALISEQTGAAVTNAFSALAHTVLSTNARTLEDLVKDMLKPMLKTWLDDNLPVMVERLVRAEIERVARGGRG